MSLILQAEQNDEQFLAEILELLDVDERICPTLDEPLCDSPKPNLKRLRRSNRGTQTKPKGSRGVASPRLRNKAKIELLRHEVKGLEALLASLQNSRGGAAILDGCRSASLWKIIATRQSYERERAEHINMGLKRMLVQHYTLTESLTHVLDEWREQPAPDLSFSACAYR